MSNSLKEGGIVALQEPINRTAHVDGDENALKVLIHAFWALGEQVGVDYDIGLRLKTLIEEQGFHFVSQDKHQYKLEPQFARELLTATHKEMGKKALDRGILSEADFYLTGEDIKNLQKPFCMSDQVYLIAQKRLA
jgi:hypothetical protein